MLCCVLVVRGVSSLAYRSSVNASLHDGLDTSVSDSLSSDVDVTQPFYALFVGLDASSQEGSSNQAIILARVDASARRVTLVSIPADTYVDLGDDYGARSLESAYELGGPSLSVKAVSTLTGVPIAHYLQADLSDVSSLVDEYGGIEVDVTQKISDGDISSVELQPGVQTLDGDQTLLFCRAKKMFADGEIALTAHQRKVGAALLEKLVEHSGIARYRAIDTFSSHIRSDMDAGDLVDVVKGLQGLDDDDICSSVLPTQTTTIDSKTYEAVDATAAKAMIDRVNAGDAPTENPDDSRVDAENVASGQYTVDIQNGSGVSGLASQAVSRVQNAGFSVGTVGNAESFNHGETLVVYKDSSAMSAADSVLTAIGVGHVTAAEDKYTFSGDVLVIIGKDWIPD